MKPNQEIRIAIVEDNRGLREDLQEMIAGAPGMTCVCAFSTAEDALRGLAKHKPDVVLMDIHLPFRSGIECTRRLKDEYPALQVLVLTVYEDSDSIFDALKAGASGYLLKRSTPSEILAAIADVAEGGSPMSSQIAREVISSFQKPAPSLKPAGEPLSEREQEILGHVRSRAEILLRFGRMVVKKLPTHDWGCESDRDSNSDLWIGSNDHFLAELNRQECVSRCYGTNG